MMGIRVLGLYRGAVTLPFVKRFHLRVVLQTSLVDQEFHALEERRGDCRRLFSQQNVNWFGRRHAELVGRAGSLCTALGVFAVG